MDARRGYYLYALGVDAFTLRDAIPDSVPESSAEVAAESADIRADAVPIAAAKEDVAGADWSRLKSLVESCRQCELHRSRSRTVFGVGNRAADLLVIGEAPGADEDRQGEPFVGRAGHLLNAMLRAIGLQRDVVYIANILKCRPPNNRDPKPDEVARCTPYLERQIELLAPRAVLAVGRIAAQHLLQSDQAIGRLRGQVLRMDKIGVPVVATYHPAYLLRSPQAKAKAWQDLCLVRSVISEQS